MCLSCQQHHTSYYELDKNQQGVISLDLVKLQTARPHNVCTLTAHWPKTSQGGASLSNKVWLPSMKTVQPIRSQPPSWQWRWKQSLMPSTGVPQKVTVGPHMPSSSQIQWACYKKWKWNRKPKQECVNGQCPPSKTLWVYCPGHVGVKENDRAERLVAKQPSQVACFSEDLKCWEVWDTTCRHKAKDITPSIDCRREVWKEEVLDNLPWKDERGPSSDGHWNRFKGNVGETSDRWDGVHMGFSEHINTTLNWTELNWTLLTTSVSVLKVRVQRNLKGKHGIKLFVSVSNNPEYS